MAHVAPRVAGVAREVLASIGDSVRTGQLLAVLESRELADAKASYLAASERKRLADATFQREERLWREKVSSEQDYLDASNGLAEARIELRAAEQKLHALGLNEKDVGRISEQPDTEFTMYRITAPFSGEVIDRHLTIGETISAETPVFTVADLSTVWIDLSVYQKDLASVKSGQKVYVKPANNGAGGEGIIQFVQPLLGEDTRTALARITAPNPDRRWKPGMFVSATVLTDAMQVDVIIPGTALIRMNDGDQVVFVETGEGFEPRPVVLGRHTQDHAEVVSGLTPGERYVARGGFSLKAELGKDAFADGDEH
jgi:cobalt-zinc-cadmium efflux system membrane fusion protein